MVNALLRQVYLHLLLHLPSLYYSRITKLFEDAQVSQPDFEHIMAAFPQRRQRDYMTSPILPTTQLTPPLPFLDDWTPSNASPALMRFKRSWEVFVNSLLREWKTFNLVSALLLSAALSMFQNQEMAYDPIVRTTALLSLTCALVSLSYGCIYIAKFGTMHSMYKATRWALEAQRSTAFNLWNVWVLLAMPSVWLAWSMIFFITSILCFVWRSGSTVDLPTRTPLSPSAAICSRILISMFVMVGFVYFMAIVKTLQGYGLEIGSVSSSRRQHEGIAGKTERRGGHKHGEKEGGDRA
ncbi:hypothetical protein ID866_10979 [Astraeus odoratus]|nr:hypothetical protein ID866_10979 [Astraeus odoratus]